MTVSQPLQPASIAGIDYDSEAVFLVLIDEDSGDWLGSTAYDLKVGPGDSFQRIRRLQRLFPGPSAWEENRVVAVGLEDLRSRQRSQIAAASRVEGALLALLPVELSLVRLSVNRRRIGWKALTVGKTNATKDEIQAWAIAEGAPAGLVPDFYDAFAIARAARATLNVTVIPPTMRGER